MTEHPMEQLNSFGASERRNAVQILAEAIKSEEWTPAAVRPWVNLHAHTFHSFNANGWSPARVVYEAKQAGLEMIGTVDFDVMDAVAETLETGDALGIKAVAGIETRIFVPEYKTRVINSPGEPGIAYFMLTGVTRLPREGTAGFRILRDFKETAQNRVRVMIDHVNAFLDQVRLDYHRDVLPLTPSGNPTERHLVEAYDAMGRRVFGAGTSGLAEFWADRFGMARSEVESLLARPTAFQEALRSKLMKKGGVGYVEPDPKWFPSLEDMLELAGEIGALPTVAWLDGTTEGEADARELLAFFVERGIVAVNIIPDRNWNIAKPDEKAIKVQKLGEMVTAARELDLPLCIGTEMNKAGLPFVDDFDAPELAPFIGDFLRGARALWGHTLAARALDGGWFGRQCEEKFGDDRRARFAYFEEIGTRFMPAPDCLDSVREASATGQL